MGNAQTGGKWWYRVALATAIVAYLGALMCTRSIGVLVGGGLAMAVAVCVYAYVAIDPSPWSARRQVVSGEWQGEGDCAASADAGSNETAPASEVGQGVEEMLQVQPAVLALDPARGVLAKAVRRKRAAVLASAPDPARVEQARLRRKRSGSARKTAMLAKEPHAGGRPVVKFAFTGAKPSGPARAMPRQDPAKTPSENAAVRMMYRGRTLPQPSNARRGLVRGMMRDFPFRPARGMVLASGYGR